jgi:hypothetical protein
MEPNTRRRVRLTMTVVLTAVVAGMVQAAAPVSVTEVPVVTIAGEGVVRVSVEGYLEERFAVPAGLRATLNTVDAGGRVRLEHWPVAPGDRRTVTVERKLVYGPQTQIFEVSDNGLRQLPRSPKRHFIGKIDDEPGSGVLVILDPRSGLVTGMSVSGGETFDLEALPGGAPSDYRVVATEERTAGQATHWGCGEEELEQPSELVDLPFATAALTVEKSTVPLEAVLAIDTDTELLSQKFGNNTSAAADYVADLIAAMNVMYSRDLDVTLIQGTTYLRTGSDPYSANSGGSASSAELNEFGNYWKNNYGSTSRALAAMLSGKSTSSYSASGIAWVGGLCSTTYGYSFSKVFKINALASDAKLVGHEIGHNFGSPHTHCYSPAIDHCVSQGGSCYSGATSCPGGPGTVMSYCHLTGCGSTLDFHPTVISRILTYNVNPATGVCIFEGSSTGMVFDDGFEAGGLGAWSSVSP